VVAADRMLTNLHGFRAPLDRGICTDSVHLSPSKLHGLGCRLSPLEVARFPCNLRCTVLVHHWTTYVLTYVDNQTRHAHACTTDQDTLPQPDYGVTQIGDCVVTQRPRDRQNAGLTESGAFTESGKLP